MADLDGLAAASAHSSLKRARHLFQSSNYIPAVDEGLHQASLDRRRRLRTGQAGHQEAETDVGGSSQSLVVADSRATGPGKLKPIVVETVHAPNEKSALVAVDSDNEDVAPKTQNTGILVKRNSQTSIPTPKWHAPWKLSTVLSSHLGWVRSIGFDPENRLFATGAADRTIKIWNFPKASVGASDALQLTLTGHISPVRALVFSPRHPYLFSCGEDKTVKCWDLETNQVIRHYHGHLSGIFAMALHPTLDILITAGRDAVGRVWDMRSKTQVMTLAGHSHTIAAVLANSIDPQITTGSHDGTIKLWELASGGKCLTTLTHHQKSIRALCQPSWERTFMSGAADGLKVWQGKDGRYLRTMTGHRAVVNACAVNDDGVAVSGGDDGSMHFWDYNTGYNFQTMQSKVQPGSLEAENAILASCFDHTGTRLVTGEADKTIKIWKPDTEASELSHPVDMAGWRKKCIAQSKERY